MRTLDDAVSVSAWITDRVLRGEMDARTAEAATKAVRQFQLGEEKVQMKREIAELRAVVASFKKRESNAAHV